MLHNMLRAAAGRAGVPQDYIAYWDMAGNALDETGNYNISLFGGAVQNADHVAFDGTDDYGQCDRLAFNNNEFSIGIRFRLDSIDATYGGWIINSRSSVSGSENEWQFYIRPSTSEISFNVANTLGDNHPAFTAIASTGTWYSIVIRFTGVNVEVYDNSGLIGSASFSGTMNSGSLNTRFAVRGWAIIGSTNHSDTDISRTIAYDYSIPESAIPHVLGLIENGVL